MSAYMIFANLLPFLLLIVGYVLTKWFSRRYMRLWYPFWWQPIVYCVWVLIISLFIATVAILTVSYGGWHPVRATTTICSVLSGSEE